MKVAPAAAAATILPYACPSDWQLDALHHHRPILILIVATQIGHHLHTPAHCALQHAADCRGLHKARGGCAGRAGQAESA